MRSRPSYPGGNEFAWMTKVLGSNFLNLFFFQTGNLLFTISLSANNLYAYLLSCRFGCHILKSFVLLCAFFFVEFSV